jgi:nickel/cobalt exporter
MSRRVRWSRVQAGRLGAARGVPVGTRALLVLLVAGAAALLPAHAAWAHPLGNFTVNTADRLLVTADGLQIDHVVDLAEIPTVQLAQPRAGIDADGNRQLSDRELSAYAARECARVAPLLSVVIDGIAVDRTVTSSSAQSRPGVAGLSTTRVECSYETGVRPRTSVEFVDPVAQERNGWREVTASSRCGALPSSSVPEDSPSDLLVSYPEDLLESPVDTNRASFTVRGDATCSAGGQDGAAAAAADVAPRGVDRLSQTFADLVGRAELTLPFALLSVAAAVLFGVLHAVAPGHGKTVMAAYLVGQRGTRRQALQLGAIVTFTHTASVLLLGALLAVGALAAPELAVPFTEVLSGVLLVAVGVYLVVLARRRLRAARHDHHHAHGHADHEHSHHDHGHSHHDHGHDDHDHAGRLHPHRLPDTLVAANALPGGTAVALATRPLTHSHGARTHTHAPLPEGRLTWKSLAGMGVAGGLVPSPSALLVLLSAAALGRAWFGVVLVVAYGLGMALTLTVAGLLLLRARALLDRRGWSLGRGQRLARLLPVGTAVVVVLLGLGLVLRGAASGRGLL